MAHRPDPATKLYTNRIINIKYFNAEFLGTLIGFLIGARHRERQFFACFSSAAARKVRRQQANLEALVYD